MSLSFTRPLFLIFLLPTVTYFSIRPSPAFNSTYTLYILYMFLPCLPASNHLGHGPSAPALHGLQAPDQEGGTDPAEPRAGAPHAHLPATLEG